MNSSLRKLILNGRVRDGELIGVIVILFTALFDLANSCECRNSNHYRRQKHHAPEQRCNTVRLCSQRVPERRHASIESKRHLSRDLVRRRLLEKKKNSMSLNMIPKIQIWTLLL